MTEEIKLALAEVEAAVAKLRALVDAAVVTPAV